MNPQDVLPPELQDRILHAFHAGVLEKGTDDLIMYVELPSNEIFSVRRDALVAEEGVSPEMKQRLSVPAIQAVSIPNPSAAFWVLVRLEDGRMIGSSVAVKRLSPGGSA